MKELALIVVACSIIATGATAGQQLEHNNHSNHRHWNGWGSGLNIYADIPMTEAAAGYRQAPVYSHCREVRHFCFGRWGVDEPGYGNCIWNHGC
jgi:hypothetical protein